MDIKQAIGVVKLALAKIEWEYPMDYAAAFDVAIEAMEKGNEKKPVLAKRGRIIQTICPECKTRIRTNYCPECGQKIDWTEAEHEV